MHELTQILPSSIDIYRRSEVHPDAFILCSEVSSHHENFIARRDSIFSPIQFLPENIVCPGFNRYRAIRIPPSANDSHRHKIFMQFIVHLERLIATQHIHRFRSFLFQCSQHAEASDNRYLLHDVLTIQASVLCTDSLSGEQLHLFLSWAPEAISLQRIIQHAVTAGIPSGFSCELMHDIELSHRFLPTLVHDTEKNDIVTYHSNRCSVRPKKTRLSVPDSEPAKNTFKQCLYYHQEEKYLPNISSFPAIPPPPQSSTFEALTSLSDNVKILLRQYGEVVSQTVDVRDIGMCHQIISDTEMLLANEQISNLSVAHRRYFRYKLRRAITETRTLQQEAAAYDPSNPTPTIRQPSATSILPFLIRRLRIDNKDPPD